MVSLHRLRTSLASTVPGQLGAQRAFFLGVAIGGTLSSVTYILVYSVLVSQLLPALGAAVTLTGVVVTTYLNLRAKGEALARELADRVLVPMRRKVLSWTDPESPPMTVPSWAQLEDEFPYLTRNVPPSLRKLLTKGETIEHDTWIYTAPMSTLIQEFAKENTPGTNARIQIREASKEEQSLGEIYLINVWKSGMGFEQYVAHYVKTRYPLVKGWNAELVVDVPVAGGGTVPKPVGMTDESKSYVNKLLKFLASSRDATTYRDKYKELANVGSHAFREIETQLRRPVAPIVSGPVEENANPFG